MLIIKESFNPELTRDGATTSENIKQISNMQSHCEDSQHIILRSDYMTLNALSQCSLIIPKESTYILLPMIGTSCMHEWDGNNNVWNNRVLSKCHNVIFPRLITRILGISAPLISRWILLSHIANWNQNIPELVLINSPPWIIYVIYLIYIITQIAAKILWFNIIRHPLQWQGKVR